MLILQRKPKLVKAMAQLTAAVWEPDGEVDRAFKRLIAHVASRTAGCQYCMAHTAGGALLFGVDPGKVADIWDFRVSPRYSEKERVALDFAIAAASQPNGVAGDVRRDAQALERNPGIVERRRGRGLRLPQPLEHARRKPAAPAGLPSRKERPGSVGGSTARVTRYPFDGRAPPNLTAAL